MRNVASITKNLSQVNIEVGNLINNDPNMYE